MSVRGFLTWYLVAIVFVGAAAASLVQGVRWQRAQRTVVAAQITTPEPAALSQDVAEASLPKITPPPLPALRPPVRREPATPRAEKPASKRTVVAKAASRPALRKPAPQTVARHAMPYPEDPRGPYATPWHAEAPYPPPSPPSPYAYYAYRAYGPYVPSYQPYGGWRRFSYY